MSRSSVHYAVYIASLDPSSPPDLSQLQVEVFGPFLEESDAVEWSDRRVMAGWPGRFHVIQPVVHFDVDTGMEQTTKFVDMSGKGRIVKPKFDVEG